MVGSHRQLALAVLSGLLSTSVFAQTNYWVNNGGYSGTFNDGSASSHWDTNPAGAGGGAAPTSSQVVTFNNGQTSPYTVTFGGDIQTSVFNVPNDNVVFNLTGYTWTSRLAGFGDPPYDYYGGSGAARIGVGANVTGTVTVATSAAGGLLRNFQSAGDASYYALGVGFGPGGSLGTLNINDSLGFGATLWHRGNLWVGYGYTGAFGEMTVSGPGSEFKSDYGGEVTIEGNGTLNVINGGKFTIGQPFNIAQSPGVAYVTVASGGILDSRSGVYSYFNPSVLTVTNGGTWKATDVQIGVFRFYSGDPMYGKMTVDGATSSFILNNLILGALGGSGDDGNAQITIQNGGTVSVTNTLRVRALTPGGVAAGIQTNNITLNNGKIVMGGATSTNNGLLQVNGILRGVGTISKGTGNPGNFTLRIGDKGQLRPGDSTGSPAIGTLNLDGGNWVQETGSSWFADLSAPGNGDVIDITNGTASISGNLGVTFTGYTPVMGDRWELAFADSITYNGSDTVAAALTPFGLQNDYSIFVEDQGSRDALILFIPEPSTAALLVLGSVFLLRRKR